MPDEPLRLVGGALRSVLGEDIAKVARACADGPTAASFFGQLARRRAARRTSAVRPVHAGSLLAETLGACVGSPPTRTGMYAAVLALPSGGERNLCPPVEEPGTRRGSRLGNWWSRFLARAQVDLPPPAVTVIQGATAGAEVLPWAARVLRETKEIDACLIGAVATSRSDGDTRQRGLQPGDLSGAVWLSEARVGDTECRLIAIASSREPVRDEGHSSDCVGQMIRRAWRGSGVEGDDVRYVVHDDCSQDRDRASAHWALADIFGQRIGVDQLAPCDVLGPLGPAGPLVQLLVARQLAERDGDGQAAMSVTSAGPTAAIVATPRTQGD